jgi:hypothetical protein
VPDVFRTVTFNYRLALTHDEVELYCGEWIAGPDVVQGDGNHPVHQAIDKGDPLYRFPESNRLLGQAGSGVGPLKCGQHTVSRWQTIWTGFFGPTFINLTDRILQPADTFFLTLMEEIEDTLTGIEQRRPEDVPLLLIGGDNYTTVDWFPKVSDSPNFIPQETDSPGWVPQDEDALVFSGKD